MMIRQTTLGRSRRTTSLIIRLLMGGVCQARGCSMFQKGSEGGECLGLCRFSIGVSGTVNIYINHSRSKLEKWYRVIWFGYGKARNLLVGNLAHKQRWDVILLNHYLYTSVVISPYLPRSSQTGTFLFLR